MLFTVTEFLKDAALQITAAFLLTPILIAVHRFILLDETTTRYAIEPFHPRFERFLVWMLLLWALSASVRLLHPLLMAGVSPAFALAAAIAAVVVVLVASARLSILLSAIAVDAPGATASNALADSKGHVFAVLGIALLATLPVFAVLIAAGLLLLPARGLAGAGIADGIAFSVVMPIVQVFAYVLAVAIASRIFQALADRLLKAPAKV